jgi:hypothetical protein
MATTRKEPHKAKPVGGEVDSVEAPEAAVEETKKVFLSIVDRQALRPGDFTSVTDLTAAIGRSCRSWNEHCSPCLDQARDEILAKLYRQTTSATEH